MKIFKTYNRLRWFTIAWLLCVNALLLAHTAVPHGHGGDVACSACTECVERAPHCDDSHGQQSNERHDDCAVDQLYSRQQSDEKHDDCACCSGLVLGLATDCGNELQAAAEPVPSVVWGPACEAPYVVIITGIRGLRAPPVC